MYTHNIILYGSSACKVKVYTWNSIIILLHDAVEISCIIILLLIQVQKLWVSQSTTKNNLVLYTEWAPYWEMITIWVFCNWQFSQGLLKEEKHLCYIVSDSVKAIHKTVHTGIVMYATCTVTVLLSIAISIKL